MRPTLRLTTTTMTLLAVGLLTLACAGCGGDDKPSDGSEVSADAPAAEDGAAEDGAAEDGAAEDGAAEDSSATPGSESPAFGDGCPKPGKAFVRQLTSDSQRFEGPASLAAKGDWLMANNKAAFVIKAPTQTEHTYAYYGGLLVDAVAIDGCAQIAPENFGEMPFLIGKLDIANFPGSVLRAFRGVKAEVLADGKDGGAVKLRVWGVDDYFWLVELTLIREAFMAGKPKVRSSPLGIQLALDYSLEPGKSAIQIDLVAINKTDEAKELHVGAAAFLDDSTAIQAWSSGSLKLGRFGLETGLPWLAGSAKHGAVVIAVDASNLASAQISGVRALVPMDQLGDPLKLSKQGTPGAEDSQRFWIGVGRDDSASAVATLEGLIIGGKKLSAATVSGTLREAGSKTPLVDTEIVLQRRRSNGDFVALLTTRSGEAGAYNLRVPRLGKAGDLRLVARGPGRISGPTVTVPLGAGPFTKLDLSLGQLAKISHDIRDDKGALIPARVSLYQSNKQVGLHFSRGQTGNFLVPAGAYDVVITRGYHYRPWTGKITVVAGKSAPLKAVLTKALDTSGWMAYDGHVHAHPSPDSIVPLTERYRSAAADGLDVVAHTEHEIIIDSEPARKASGVAKWVRGVAGQEVTASLPAHTNIVGVTPDPSHRRGAPIKWHGLDLAQIYAKERARKVGIISLNHPRKGCNWLCLIGWDRIKIAPTQVDPEVVGLAKSATLWSWDFDSVEVLGGMDSDLFLDSKNPDRTGTFEDWMSFWNGGHRITGIAVTDVHNLNPPGQPRTFFRVPSDATAAFKPDWLTTSVKAGQAIMSAGAFARVSVADGKGGSKGPGDLVTAKGGEIALKVSIEAIPEIDVTRVLVLVNCDTVVDVAAKSPNDVVKLAKTFTLKLKQDSHVVVLAFGKKAMPRGFRSAVASKIPRVITNPIRVDVDGDGKWTPPGGKTCAIKPGG